MLTISLRQVSALGGLAADLGELSGRGPSRVNVIRRQSGSVKE
jgi:hypothetical protein